MPNKYTNAEKVFELSRELRLRKKVYPGLIEQGKITKEQANHQYLVLQEILWDYKNKGTLFDTTE